MIWSPKPSLKRNLKALFRIPLRSGQLGEIEEALDGIDPNLLPPLLDLSARLVIHSQATTFLFLKGAKGMILEIEDPQVARKVLEIGKTVADHSWRSIISYLESCPVLFRLLDSPENFLWLLGEGEKIAKRSWLAFN